MAGQLAITIGQYSDKGRKETNQDFHGALIPEEPLLTLKGVAVVIADGISSSDVGGIASQSAVKSFLTDYYATPDTWSVRLSAQRVIDAANSWLHAQTRRSQHPHERDKGYVCTLSALIVRARVAHIFHVGDARIYRLTANALEQLTEDHRVFLSSVEIYLGRALGVNRKIEIDYRAVPLDPGDTFVLVTDGVHEHVDQQFVAEMVRGATCDLDTAARAIAEEAHRRGSPDNLTVEILRIDALGSGELGDLLGSSADLAPPPLLEARTVIDGYRIEREIHGSSRSHIYLATDTASGDRVAIKTPSVDLRDNPDYLRRFHMEEWIARRIDNPHVLRPRPQSRTRSYLYIATEFIEGQTLKQWMIDRPSPTLEAVRGVIEQVAKGLQAFHRLEMLHQDLRPDNIMIDHAGTVKIIDFGSTRVSGIADDPSFGGTEEILGTLQYTAPEYFTGNAASTASDIFSLGVIAYQMLTGRLPYGADVAKVRSKSHLRKLRYRPAVDDHREIPGWVDKTLRTAVHPDPGRRYAELSEFMFDLSHPGKNAETAPVSLMDRNPVLFWQCVSAILAIVVLCLLLALR